MLVGVSCIYAVEVFELLTEIKNIGDKNQYEEYLSNIFPNSKVKDILYHGSPSERFEKFTKAGELDRFLSISFYI